MPKQPTRHSAGLPPLRQRARRALRARSPRHLATTTLPLASVFPPRPAPPTIPMPLGARLAAFLGPDAR